MLLKLNNAQRNLPPRGTYCLAGPSPRTVSTIAMIGEGKNET